ncbi:MAG: cation:proton antiporter [Longimicrobiales bacterium]
MIELLALTGVVILISAVSSGALERRGISLVLLFLAIGFVAGPHGLGLADFTLDSPLLQLVATVSLTMVLFADAVSVQPPLMRAHARLATRILGPGTLITAALIALASYWLLDIPAAGSAMIGAALASTDPVLLRSVLRNPRVPEPVRQALRMESGLNDAVLLPIVLIAMTVAGGHASSAGYLVRTLGNLLVIGPLAGAVVGLLCVLALEYVRARFGVRRDYESLYTLGVALTAFAVAEALHTSGFLAAFTAGLAIAFRDVELCDCFHDYGEATAEVALLLTFVALGGTLIWSGLPLLDVRHVAFIVLALAIRPIVLVVVLRGTDLSRRDLGLLAWFGPRGLSSLLLILLPVFDGLPGSDRLFAVCSLVVLASVVLHGASPALLMRSVEPTGVSEDARIRLTLDELDALRSRAERVHVLDVRTENSFAAERNMAAGALRVNPDYAVAEVKRLGLPRDAWLALYCT